jgi:hypothetical protein
MVAIFRCLILSLQRQLTHNGVHGSVQRPWPLPKELISHKIPSHTNDARNGIAISRWALEASISPDQSLRPRK